MCIRLSIEGWICSCTSTSQTRTSLLLLQVSVLGPFADSPEMLLGNYYGTPAGPVTTPFKAIKVRSCSPADHTSTIRPSAARFKTDVRISQDFAFPGMPDAACISQGQSCDTKGCTN